MVADIKDGKFLYEYSDECLSSIIEELELRQQQHLFDS